MQLIVDSIQCYNGGNATAILGRIQLSKKKGGICYEYIAGYYAWDGVIYKKDETD